MIKMQTLISAPNLAFARKIAHDNGIPYGRWKHIPEYPNSPHRRRERLAGLRGYTEADLIGGFYQSEIDELTRPL